MKKLRCGFSREINTFKGYLSYRDRDLKNFRLMLISAKRIKKQGSEKPFRCPSAYRFKDSKRVFAKEFMGYLFFERSECCAVRWLVR